jgi:hypothetical protein
MLVDIEAHDLLIKRLNFFVYSLFKIIHVTKCQLQDFLSHKLLVLISCFDKIEQVVVKANFEVCIIDFILDEFGFHLDILVLHPLV